MLPSEAGRLVTRENAHEYIRCLIEEALEEAEKEALAPSETPPGEGGGEVREE